MSRRVSCHRSRPMSCPVCGQHQDAHTNLGPDGHGAPRDGDFTLCANCGSALRFASGPQGLYFEIVTERELQVLARDEPEVASLLLRTRQAIKDGLRWRCDA